MIMSTEAQSTAVWTRLRHTDKRVRHTNVELRRTRPNYVIIPCTPIEANNTNLHDISHYLQDIAECALLVEFLPSTGGVPLFNALLSGEFLNSERRN